jgi:nanoRNase/pAp phosphatase (c-di-AMP/oligoRNAs hydrolase)
MDTSSALAGKKMADERILFIIDHHGKATKPNHFVLHRRVWQLLATVLAWTPPRLRFHEESAEAFAEALETNDLRGCLRIQMSVEPHDPDDNTALQWILDQGGEGRVKEFCSFLRQGAFRVEDLT